MRSHLNHTQSVDKDLTGNQSSSGFTRDGQKMVATRGKANRIPALDFTKGALVLIMVLYHWINYFYGPHDNRYLRFLTPSFIFITGFLISNIYMSKYGVSDPQLPKRLLQRGLKLLGVFILLNLTRSLLVHGWSQDQFPSATWSIKSLIDVYITGTGVGGGQSKAVAFFILVPISYLLIMSALFMVVAKVYRYTFHVVCFLLLLCIVVMGFQGLQSPNLELLAIGLLGVITGYLPTKKVNEFVGHPYLIAAGYLLYLVAITFWNVAYPLQIIGVYLTLMIIYLVGQHGDQSGRIKACFLLLGKYSLVGYIAQIAILQLLRIGLNSIDSRAVVLGVSFVLAFSLTIASVELLDRMRVKSTAVDRVYKVVFA